MRRGLAPLALALALVPSAVRAQGLEPIKLTLTPKAAPTPALKYKLLPESRDLQPGNSVQLYYRAFSPEWTFFRRPEISKKIDAWSEDPRKVPGADLAFVLNASVLKELDLAARREYCDWELTPRIRKDGIGLLLPDVQAFREYIRLLALRARLEAAAGKHDKAAKTIQTAFRMSRDVSNAPVLINNLVGIAMAHVMFVQLEEWIQSPGSPNLYWALTSLPRPFIDMRKAFEGERVMIDSLFPGIREALEDLDAEEMDTKTLDKFADTMVSLAGQVGEADKFVKGRAGLAAYTAKVYPQAKKFLLSQGRSAKRVEALPTLQVVMMYEVYQYDRVYDDMIKWYGFPFAKMQQEVSTLYKKLRRDAEQSQGLTLAMLLVPAIEKVTQAGARSDRRIAALRCIEAIRMHAAANKGQAPARLSDIRVVPVPDDPFTCKPFEYKVKDDTITLFGPPPAGEAGNAGNTLHYQLTLKR